MTDEDLDRIEKLMRTDTPGPHTYVMAANVVLPLIAEVRRLRADPHHSADPDARGDSRPAQGGRGVPGGRREARAGGGGAGRRRGGRGMTDEELDRIEALANAATPGPWAHDGPAGTVNTEDEEPYRSFIFGDGTIVAEDPREGNGKDDENAAFIAAARTAVPALVAEVRRLRAQVDAALLVALTAHGVESK